MEVDEIASRLSTSLSTSSKKVTLEEGVDFYLEEPPQPRQRVGYLATQSRFVLYDIQLAVVAKDFATEIPGY